MRRWGRREGRAPLVVAHRGASRKALENTLAAFRLARDDGADAVELDVRACRSGEVVVFHDEDLRRLAGRPDRIAELPLEAVREVALVAAAGGGGISLLAEVLEELGPGMLVNVEIKAPRALAAGMGRLVAGVTRVVDACGAGARVLVSSFNPIALGMVRVLAPGMATGLLCGSEQGRALREGWARWLVRPAAVHPENVLVTEETVGRWRNEGLAVNVWTVDAESEVVRVTAAGVDGIITNDPAATRGFLA